MPCCCGCDPSPPPSTAGVPCWHKVESSDVASWDGCTGIISTVTGFLVFPSLKLRIKIFLGFPFSLFFVISFQLPRQLVDIVNHTSYDRWTPPSLAPAWFQWWEFFLPLLLKKQGTWSQFHERTISLKFLDIILRVLRLKVSVCIS
jgi:hypothetical protein